MNSDAGHHTAASCMPGTQGCFFYATPRRKGTRVSNQRFYGFGALAGGWEWERGNPLGFPQEYFSNHMWVLVGFGAERMFVCYPQTVWGKKGEFNEHAWYKHVLDRKCESL